MLSVMSGIIGPVFADTNTAQSNGTGTAATDKGSKSPSPLVDKIKEVGNEASKGIHRATQPVRDIGDKTGKKTKTPEKEK